jgi:hypothetical protein
VAKNHRFLVVLSIGLAGWGILLFFESTYFGAQYYGQPVPSWDTWIPLLTPLGLNLIDTFFVVLYFLALYLSWEETPRHQFRGSSRGSATGVALLIIFLVLLAFFLGYLGLTLTGILHGAGNFLGL